ncbi:MAG TPA: hypothetical protein VFR03_09830 [Thermoanaerobaculia bacterium]|nr:hypothetical protein [Thermoanaerobaculia bacterium]
MSSSRKSAVLLSALLSLTPLALAGAAEAPKNEIKGAAILDHPCGKVAVKQMGLIHAGKLEEANKLTTKEMQEKWNAMPAKDREMMAGMMKEISKSEADFAKEIKDHGNLVVLGNTATLTVKREHKDANGSSTETMTQNYVIDGDKCLISR